MPTPTFMRIRKPNQRHAVEYNASVTFVSEYTYTAEFASGARAKLTLSTTSARIDWTPDIPRSLKGQRRQRFLAAYRHWRNECVSDYARRSGDGVLIVEI
jgi:hypothetical protein